LTNFRGPNQRRYRGGVTPNPRITVLFFIEDGTEKSCTVRTVTQIVIDDRNVVDNKVHRNNRNYSGELGLYSTVEFDKRQNKTAVKNPHYVNECLTVRTFPTNNACSVPPTTRAALSSDVTE